MGTYGVGCSASSSEPIYSCGGVGGLIGGGAGVLAGIPLGVSLIGSLGDEMGSLGAAYGGELIGSLVGVGTLLLLSSAQGAQTVPHIWPVAGVFAASAPVIGSVVGFNLTRRYRHPRAQTMTWAPAIDASAHRTVVGIVGRF